MIGLLRRLRPGQALGILLGGSLLFVGTAWFFVQAAINRRWAAAQLKADELDRVMSDRPGTRPILWGESRIGQAWDAYSKAITTPFAWETELTYRFRHFSSHTNEPDPQLIRKMITRRQKELEFLRAGAHCVDLGPAPKEFLRQCDPEFSPIEFVSGLMMWDARFALADDRPREAAEIALEACQFACDVGRVPIPKAYGLSARCFRDAFEVLQEIVTSRKVRTEDCALIESALALLDLGFPTDEDKERAVALSDAKDWLNREPEVTDQSIARMRPIAFWEKRHFLFSSRVMVAQAIEFVTTGMDSLRGVDDLSVDEADKVFQAYWDAAKESKNPILKENVFPHLNHRMRFPRAQLRLLRAASHFRATGKVEETRDPFGAILLHEMRDNRLVIWSVGSNGKDDHGNGTFDCRLMDQGSEDIVITVER